MIVCPTLIARNMDHPYIEEKIGKMWAVHKNRVDQGKKGTFSTTGFHESFDPEWQSHAQLFNGYTVDFESLIFGTKTTNKVNHPFIRFKHMLNEFG